MTGAEVAAEIEVSGILIMGADRRAAIRILGGDNPVIWRAEEDVVGPASIAEIRSGSVRFRMIADEENGTEFVVPLKESVVRDDRGVGGRKENMSKAQVRWINSHENPMLLAPIPPPGIIDRWTSLSASEKQALARWWFDHGWKVAVTVKKTGDDGEVLSFEMENVFEEERQRAIAENRLRFLDSLSDGQRQLYDDMTTAGRAGAHIRADEEARELRERTRAAFFESLSPEELARFEQIPDFTSFFSAMPDEPAKNRGGVE